MRRVGSIALVHELLSTTPDESVPFDQVADRVLSMVAEVSSSEGGVRPARKGTFGVVPAEVATPLAVVLSEIVQNAVEHGLRGSAGTLVVVAERDGTRLRVEVLDDGVGLPVGFDPAISDRLGLQIVRTLVEAELGGSLVLEGRPEGGTRAVVEISVER